MLNKKTMKKILIIIFIISAVALFFTFELNQYLTLEYLKQSKQSLSELYNNNQAAVIAVYMLIYIIATALSLPGAVPLTLAGGALFGFWRGVIIVSFASTTGATLACFVSRFLLRDLVQNKFGEKLQVINSGIEREGGFYLFSMRLIPIFPFFLINLLMGLTKYPLYKFFLISQVGMLAGTMVYVNAGKELAKINSASDILSASLFISFALLGLFPLIVKKIMDHVKKKKHNTQAN